MAEKQYILGNKAKDLLIHTTKLTMNTNLFPKSVRFTYCHELQNTATAILRNIHAANECFFVTEYRRRLETIQRVLDDCNYMLQLLDICMELQFIDARRCQHWSSLVLDIKYMSASWKKKDGERAQNLIAEEERREAAKQRAAIQEIIQSIRA